MAKRRIKDVDKGWGRIKKDLRELDYSHTKVGIQQSSNLGDRSLGEMATIGAVHEFGAPKRSIPTRSYMRTTFDEQQREIRKLTEQLKSKVMQGKISTERGLAILGEFMATKIKQKITDLKFPPLKNPSLRRRGSPGAVPNPLVDTGQLRASITHSEVIK